MPRLKDGTPICVLCGDVLSNENWNKSHKESSDYRCRPCYSKKSKEYRKRNPDIEFKARLIRNYNITFEEYMIMFNQQQGKCFICGNKEPVINPSGKRRWLAVDHCHTDGHIRRLLCVKCNSGLGNFNDDTDLLKKAIKYLEDH